MVKIQSRPLNWVKGQFLTIFKKVSVLPWDRETIINSVVKTGRCIVTHEAPITCGFGAEICATVAQECFFDLEAPPSRVAG